MPASASDNRRYVCQLLLLLAVLVSCQTATAQDRISHPAPATPRLEHPPAQDKPLQRPSVNLRLREGDRAAGGRADDKEVEEKEAQGNEERMKQAEKEARDDNQEAGGFSRDTLRKIQDSLEQETQSIRSISGD